MKSSALVILSVVLSYGVYSQARHQCGEVFCSETERCMFDTFLKQHECVRCPGHGLAQNYANKCGTTQGRKPGYPLTAIECCDNERCIQDKIWKMYYCSPMELRI